MKRTDTIKTMMNFVSHNQRTAAALALGATPIAGAFILKKRKRPKDKKL